MPCLTKPDRLILELPTQEGWKTNLGGLLVSRHSLINRPGVEQLLVVWCSGNVVGQINEVSTWMGDRLRTGKPSRYVTATEVNSAFYPLWDGKMSISFRDE